MKAIKPDSAGIVYPYIKNTWNTQFRIEAELDSEVDISLVRKALAEIYNRFPSYFVKLTKQKQIYVMIPVEFTDVVFEESPELFKPFDPENEIPFRVLVHKNRLALEVYHLLSDAHAGLVFFKTMLAHYFVLSGKQVEYDKETLCPFHEPSDDELRDPFTDIYLQGEPKNGFSGDVSTFSYQYCPNDPRTTIAVTLLQMPFKQLHALAKKYETTVGIFLASVYLYAFYLYDGKKQKKPIRISIPVDLRRRFESVSMRNFSLSNTVGFSPRKDNWTLEKIIEVVAKQMEAQLTTEYFINQAYTNVRASNSKLFEIIPIPIKAFAFRIGCEIFGERLFGSTLSNLGKTDVPDSIKDHVLSLRMLLGEDLIKQINLSATTYNDTLELCFTSRVENQSVQNIMANLLRENGIDVKRIERKVGSKEYVPVPSN